MVTTDTTNTTIKVETTSTSTLEMFEQVSNKTDDHEYFLSVPNGYVKGKTKYVITVGTVISGLGKGIFNSSLANLLKEEDFNVEPIKFEGYLNIDSGTLNPYRHGEVFVLDDGMEADMDLGTYERFLDKNLSKHNFTTNGQIFKAILSQERKGDYLGKDVQFVPHVTGYIKRMLRNLAMEKNPDIIFVEIGGTVGDLENSHYLEAMRELQYEEGKDNVCFVALTYILKPKALGEQKSKAAQQGLRALREKGIQPDFIACRASTEVSQKVIEKISINASVPVEHVFSMHDRKSIYTIPLAMKKQNLDKMILSRLKIHVKDELKSEKQISDGWSWVDYEKEILKPKSKKVIIGITGKYTGLRDSYASIINALEHSSVHNGVDFEIKWIETTDIENNKIKVEDLNVDGIIVPGGFGKRGTEGKIRCVEYARKNKIPFLGLCLGFQMAVIEFARNVCLMENANTTEVNPNTKFPVIDILPQQKHLNSMGGNMRLGGRFVEVKKNTLAYSLYKKEKIRERFRHRYEVQPSMIKTLESKGLIFSGKAPNETIMQILELSKKDHPYFIASQFHPEFTSKPLNPNPLFFGFIKSIKDLK